MLRGLLPLRLLARFGTGSLRRARREVFRRSLLTFGADLFRSEQLTYRQRQLFRGAAQLGVDLFDAKSGMLRHERKKPFPELFQCRRIALRAASARSTATAVCPSATRFSGARRATEHCEEFIAGDILKAVDKFAGKGFDSLDSCLVHGYGATLRQPDEVQQIATPPLFRPSSRQM